MKVSTKTVLDIETGEVVYREGFDYFGPVAQAFSTGSTKSQSRSQSNQESGTRFNEDFLNQAFNYFNPANKTKQTTPAGAFDAARYLKENPDVAADSYFSKNPQAHYEQYGKAEGRAYPGDQGDQGVSGERYTGPDYNPEYVKGQFTPGTYTPVDGGDFAKIEQNLYTGNQAKLAQAYNTNVARQREELSQSGALNSPAQFLEGSARSSLDRSYLDSLQQAARDASTTALGLKQQEAARRTGYDVGEGTRRTAYDVGEAERQTGFNVDTQSKLMQLFLSKLQLALEAGKYGMGESTAYGTGSGSQLGIVTFGPSNTSSSTTNKP